MACMERHPASFILLVLPFLLSLFLLASSANACVPGSYRTCLDLGVQGATMSWTYHAAQSRLDLAFSGVATSPSGWVGWGINPNGWGMVGSSALVAFRGPAGGAPTVETYRLASAGGKLVPGPSDLVVLSKAVAIRGARITIYASLRLRRGQTMLNIVWNHGSRVVGLSPQPHSMLSQDLRGFTTIDVTRGSV